jgi:SNF2 family DNA or RNA helicase
VGLKLLIQAQSNYLFSSTLHPLPIFVSSFLFVLLSDEMGLGKTIQAIAFLVCMKNEKLNSKPVLVIAPKSTLPGWDQVGVIWSCKVVGFIGFM